MKIIFFLRIQDAQNKSNKCNYFATRSMIFCAASHLYPALDGAERIMMIDLCVPGDCKIRRKRKLSTTYEHKILHLTVEIDEKNSFITQRVELNAWP